MSITLPMRCPRCQRDYGAGVTSCQECGGDLTETSASRKANPKWFEPVGALMTLLGIAIYFVRSIADGIGRDEVAAAQIRTFLAIPMFIIGLMLWRKGVKINIKKDRRGKDRLRRRSRM